MLSRTATVVVAALLLAGVTAQGPGPAPAPAPAASGSMMSFSGATCQGEVTASSAGSFGASGCGGRGEVASCCNMSPMSNGMYPTGTMCVKDTMSSGVSTSCGQGYYPGYTSTACCQLGPPAAPAPAPAATVACASQQTFLTTPASFSTEDGSTTTTTQCSSGAAITAFEIVPAVAMSGASDSRIFSVQGRCTDGTTTTNVSLPAAPSGSSTCFQYTPGALAMAPSNSNPALYWNVYYRWDNYLDGLLGFGSFSSASSHPGVFSCPGNSYVVGFTATASCNGFTAFQMICSSCNSQLASLPYPNKAQGSQGNPSNPQPVLSCNTNPSNFTAVDPSFSGGNRLAHYTAAMAPTPDVSELAYPANGNGCVRPFNGDATNYIHCDAMAGQDQSEMVGIKSCCNNQPPGRSNMFPSGTECIADTSSAQPGNCPASGFYQIACCTSNMTDAQISASMAPKSSAPMSSMMAPAPAPMGRYRPGRTLNVISCTGGAYITEWVITSAIVGDGARRVIAIQGLCSDATVTAIANSQPSSACTLINQTTSMVQSNSNPPAWWNLYIKTDLHLDSFLNVGAALSVGTAQVVSCPANGYIQGIALVGGCNGFLAMELICSSCASSLAPLLGPNSRDGATYGNQGFQVLAAYQLYGMAGVIDNTQDSNAKHAGNNLPNNVTDGASVRLLIRYRLSGVGIYPLNATLQQAFVTAVFNVINATDSKADIRYLNSTLITSRRSLLQAVQNTNVNMHVTTTSASSVAQVLTSNSGQQGFELYFTENYPGLTLSGPTISEDQVVTTQASPVPAANQCTGSYHFGHWCHTSIRRGGIIAIIVIGSLIVLGLIIAAVAVAMMAGGRRRNTAARSTGNTATPWNDNAGGNANVAVNSPASARK